MKAITLLAVATVFSSIALPCHALKLACWDLYSKRGTPPTLTAEIRENDFLVNVNYGAVNSAFGEIKIPADALKEVTGLPITAVTSPYKGGQRFSMLPETDIGTIELILPADLNSSALADFHFEAGELPDDLMARQNGVLDVSGHFTELGGHTYTRMHCVSR